MSEIPAEFGWILRLTYSNGSDFFLVPIPSMPSVGYQLCMGWNQVGLEMTEWIFSGPLKDAFDFALTKAKIYDYRYLVRRRKIGGISLTHLDGTPVWDIVRLEN